MGGEVVSEATSRFNSSVNLDDFGTSSSAVIVVKRS